ncbi:MAG TPA: UbiA family prenyltransferase [Anaerolineales bacterium]|nr:UbiA family prenyltransferase [Anaerolineales bacterium]
MKSRLRSYWSLIKSLQTSLLLMTGAAGYLSAHAAMRWGDFLGLLPSLFLAISGSTILNMWWDRDIDARMKRTHMRPAPSGDTSSSEVLVLGILVSTVGIGWAFLLNVRYGIVVLAGLFFDVVIYTMWLKRRTCWAIVWGGIAGAMPVLSGRVLAINRLDPIGVLLAASILFWIPTHTLTFSLKFADDYLAAGVPTFPSTYGIRFTRLAIAISSIAAGVSMITASVWIGVAEGILALIIILSGVLLFLAATVVLRPSDKTNLWLYKYASLYMLLTMLLLIPARF